MRRAAKVDSNQRAIKKALEAIGCSVYYIKEPVDLLVGCRRKGIRTTIALEVKNPEASPRLTSQQKEFFASFHGEAYIVEDVGQALKAVLGT